MRFVHDGLYRHAHAVFRAVLRAVRRRGRACVHAARLPRSVCRDAARIYCGAPVQSAFVRAVSSRYACVRRARRAVFCGGVLLGGSERVGRVHDILRRADIRGRAHHLQILRVFRARAADRRRCGRAVGVFRVPVRCGRGCRGGDGSML